MYFDPSMKRERENNKRKKKEEKKRGKKRRMSNLHTYPKSCSQNSRFIFTLLTIIADENGIDGYCKW